MKLWKTSKDTLTVKDIEDTLEKHEEEVKPRLDKLWQYYEGKNPSILSRPKGDPNNPDNRTPVSYARKIVTTFTGYAYRPRYTTYKVEEDAFEPYMIALHETFNLSREHIRTHRAGRNTAIFGVAYELMYIDEFNRQAEPRFIAVDPREMVLLYDYSPDPHIKMGIRYYRITDDLQKVEVYYPDRIELYERRRDDKSEWQVFPTGTEANYFDDVPIIPYYMGDDRLGVIDPVIPLIDDYDIIFSDSINEFERFAHAYMRMVKMGLVSPELKKEPTALSQALRRLRQLRVFENLPEKDAVTFLTKDIPKDFIEWMTETLREQIHVQSHVPDFSSERFGTAMSGAAIDRLLFDFENVVSSAEADFETGLYRRIELINAIYRKTGKLSGDAPSVVITHKRNMPTNIEEFAKTAVSLKQAGFSRYLIADAMPDDLIPDVEQELERQDEDMAAFRTLMPDVDEETEGDAES